MTPNTRAPRPRDRRLFDVLVIGAGQAGLAVARELLACGIAVRIVDASDRIGNSWRQRWDGLRLFSTRAYSSLPGLRMAGDPGGYPDKDEVADYLEAYAAMLSLSVGSCRRVARLRRSDAGFTVVMADGECEEARSVVVATGAFQHPFVPRALASSLSAAVVQMHVSEFDRAAMRTGRTLVVGGGASGRQIARGLATDQDVWLSARSRVMVQPRRIFGVDSMTWMDRLGFLWVPPHTLRGRIAARSMAFPGREYSDRQLRRAGVRLVGAAVQAHDRSIGFRCGAQCTFDNVIWATGYRTDDRWIEVPGATADGLAIHERGISAVQGLFFIGREYQTCRASSLLCGVGRDAAFIAGEAGSFLWSKALGGPPGSPPARRLRQEG